MARSLINLSQLLQTAQAHSALRIAPQDDLQGLTEDLSDVVDLADPGQRAQVEAVLKRKGYSPEQIRGFLQGSIKPEQDLGLDKG